MKDLLKFLDASPTCFHAIASVKEALEEACYSEVSESDAWRLSKARKCYVTRNSSSLIAFCIPEKPIKGFHIFTAHSDSPCFRLKENPEMGFEEKYIRLNVEKYGGMILSTWLDRPLSVAGRVVVNTKNGLEERLVNIDRDLCVIPNVAIHMNRDINDGFKYSVQSDMLPLFSDISGKGSFDRMIAKEAGCDVKDILGKDLFLYTRQKATKIGAKKEFILSPRLDDLECVYAGLAGLLDAEGGEHIKVLAIFDNEEIGSGTKQGADSTFLEDTLFRIAESLSYSRTDYLRLIANSFLMSADNAHAAHPAAGGKACPTNRPVMNKGVVVKFNGNQKYATDAMSAAFLRKICLDNDIPTQNYANQSDIAGGSTLGNISTAHVSLNTVDIGLAQLAMHSSVETAGAKDAEYMAKLAKCFYEL